MKIFTNESIKAKIVLNNPEIILLSQHLQSCYHSFLGGDVQVSLETSEKAIPKNTAKAISEKCDNKLIICQGDTITREAISSLSNITNRINQLLKESNQENLIENVVIQLTNLIKRKKILMNLYIYQSRNFRVK